MVSLETLNPGQRGEIMQIAHCGGCGGGCHGREPGQAGQRSGATRAEEMGLSAGKLVEMLKNNDDLLLLQVDDERITIDRRMAAKIMVREENGKLPGMRRRELR